MYKFCNKCGNITLGNRHLEEKCSVCGKVKIPIPINYIQENEILTDKELDDKKIIIIEELVKASPEFDQYLFDHKDEILAKQSAEFNAKMEHGKAVLEGRDKGNKFGVECPYCKSKHTKKISTTSRMISTSLFGLGSKKIGKQWHCNECGSDF